MSLHIIKLCVGAQSIEDLSDWQKQRRRDHGVIAHRTRMIPKRREELLDGGSIYWVIKGQIAVRQPLADLRVMTCDDGIKRCDLVLKEGLIPVYPTPRRAFQGWRYLNEEDAPDDLNEKTMGLGAIHPKMRADLVELCLI